ncbi:tetratricopeptide repeat protein [Thalassomonas actiniarum]|uniref:histidine kinase n=1 Tax=Thalassomonas actiniarum TaxID=485447 RepID=A0AAF0C448_9GAMM|nr:tetratricopeptide repeat protein [Thalassomonas actiniarum]WDD99625.1 tetratricopeptide repeat protein [Thalassomonas actiniarum]
MKLSCRVIAVLLLSLHNCALAMTVEQASAKVEQAEKIRNDQPQQAIELFTAVADDPEMLTRPDILFPALNSLVFVLIGQAKFEQAKVMAQKLFDQSLKQNDDYYPAMSQLLLGYVEENRSNYQLAESHHKFALELALKADDPVLIAQAYDRISSTLRFQDKYLEALEMVQKSVVILREQNDDKVLATTLQTLGIIQGIIGDYTTALATHTEALELRTALQDKSGISDSLYEIGGIYRKMKNFSLALKHGKMSYELDKKFGRKLDIANSANRVATMALKTKDLALAKAFSQEVLERYTELDSQSGISGAYDLLGLIALESGDLEQAKIHIDKAMAIAAEHNLASTLISAQISRIKVAQLEKDFATAQVLGEQALASAAEIKEKEDEIILQQLLADTYYGQEDYQKAFEAQRQYKKLDDEVGTRNLAQTVAALQSKAEFMRRQQEIENLNHEKALQAAELQQKKLERNAWIFGLSFLTLLVASISYRQYKKRKMAAERATLLQEVVDSKNRLLADVSHELRTPLTALKLQVEALQFNLVQDVDASYDAMNRKVMDINRLISDIYQLAQADSASLHLHPESIELDETLTQWNEEFEAFVEAKGFDWQSKIKLVDDVSVQWDQDRIKQVLTNLLSNSTFYTDAPGKIALSVEQTAQHIDICIEDSAPGVADADLQKIFERLYRVEDSRNRQTGGSGLGLSICKSLITAHHGKVRAGHSELGGLKVEIRLPLAAA